MNHSTKMRSDDLNDARESLQPKGIYRSEDNHEPSGAQKAHNRVTAQSLLIAKESTPSHISIIILKQSHWMTKVGRSADRIICRNQAL
jgi:hypothetical protein